MLNRVLVTCSAVSVVLVASGPASLACSTPVFRYALERWWPDPYEIAVFHRGPLDKTTETLLARLDTPPWSQANVRVRTVDLAGKVPEWAVALWKDQENQQLPRLVACYPRRAETLDCFWSAPLTEASLNTVLDSPKRREIARHLVGAACAVWVLLESGQADKDAAAEKTLKMQLAEERKEIKQQASSAEDVGMPEEVQMLYQELSFAVMRLSRKDPAEAAFVAMLLGSEEDLADLTEPMAFAIFGRGRLLWALVGEGISTDNIRETCAGLTGPCSCQVKAANPGIDLLVTANWEELIMGQLVGDDPVPELTGLSPFAEAPATLPTADPATGPTTRAATSEPSPATRETTRKHAKPKPPGRSLVQNLFMALGVLVAIVLVISVSVRRRRGD